MHTFCFLASKLLPDFVVVLPISIITSEIITLIFVIILLPSSLLRCYKLPFFILRMCLFLFFTRAYFVIGPWAVDLACKEVKF
jgi:hypothetical protein